MDGISQLPKGAIGTVLVLCGAKSMAAGQGVSTRCRVCLFRSAASASDK